MKDTVDVQMSLLAIVADAIAIFLGFILATWLFFVCRWFPIGPKEHAELWLQELWRMYPIGAAIATPLFLLVFRSLGLFVRPQLGSFGDAIPRTVRAVGIGILLTMVLGFLAKNVGPGYSTKVILLSSFTIGALVLVERAFLFEMEIQHAKASPIANRTLILGTNNTAAHLREALAQEPRLRSETIGFLRTDISEPDPSITPDMIKGTVEEFHRLIDNGEQIDQVILTDSRLDHDQIVNVMLMCDRNLITFKLVPDIFRILTGNVNVETIADVPLLGLRPWPLDIYWNRLFKRAEDVVGAVMGLLIAAPIIAVTAILIKRDSPGPVFYRQERCGEKGKVFMLFKLRTMPIDAETQSGPVWASKDDQRCTKIGATLRQYNIDELPQLWNVLRGDMSLVGPRPERPHFVEQFKEDIGRYMWRHVSKPGMTGWAQVNGLRGNTSIDERVKYDLYYLENWALAFDFKILVKTLFARENAY